MAGYPGPPFRVFPLFLQRSDRPKPFQLCENTFPLKKEITTGLLRGIGYLPPGTSSNEVTVVKAVAGIVLMALIPKHKGVRNRGFGIDFAVLFGTLEILISLL